MEQHQSFLTGILCPGMRQEVASCTEFHDPACGVYSLHDDLCSLLRSDARLRNQTASVLAVRRRRGLDRRTLILPDSYTGRLGADDTGRRLGSLVSEYPRSVPEMLDECLVNLAIGLGHPSEAASLNDYSHWWLYSDNIPKSVYFLNALEAADWIKVLQRVGGVVKSVGIQPRGWERLTELQRRPAGAKNQAFVAMWFDPQTEAVFNDGIRPAVEEDGTRCMRIDLKEHNNKICDEIIAEIRRSKYLVADFTGNRGGVYYEAGFAHGLGIPVIWTVHADEVANLHFDTRQYAHITYTTPDELEGKLLNRIRATIK